MFLGLPLSQQSLEYQKFVGGSQNKFTALYLFERHRELSQKVFGMEVGCEPDGG